MPRTEPQNLLILLSDEHNRRIAGCYGHPFVRTPAIDALAARGTRFDAAYCNSPICVPSRAALATGRYVHRTRHWDNAAPYCGAPLSWHHALRDGGCEVVSAGKLHFRGSEDDNGFSREILPVHVRDGVGDLKGLLRREAYRSPAQANLAREAGVGESSYYRFDQEVAARASDWLAERGAKPGDRPFALFVSFVLPHFPMIAPERYYSLYEGFGLEELRQGLDEPAPDHPALKEMRRSFDHDAHFDDERREVALRAYFALVTALDDHIAQVLAALEASGLSGSTRVIYASDHGDNLGSRGMWEKSVFYEDSAAIPMIAVGDGFPARAEATPVSLVDIAPTALEALGVSAPEVGDGFDGASLFDVVRSPDPERVAFSEYHAESARSGGFMLRRGRFKYVCYVGFPPQLFDLEADPFERADLASDPAHAGLLADLDAALRRIVDPDEASAQAFADQSALIARHGGVEAVLASEDLAYTPVSSD